MKEPSLIYYLALLIWPFVTASFLKRFEIDKAVILCIVVAYLILPVPPFPNPVDLPLLPPIDKAFVSIASLFILLKLRKVKLTYFPKSIFGKLCFFALLLSPFMTYITNTDAQYFGPTVLPGLQFREAISNTLAQAIAYILPFALGYSFLGTDSAHQKLVRIIAVSGLIYALFMLWEIRMSPQLHIDVYGFFPHEWGQQKRGDGFRPVVFLGHGLHTAFFAMMTAICVFVMAKEKDPVLKRKGWLFLVFMLATLFLCKTFSVVIYFLIFIGAYLFLSQRWQLNFSAVVVAFLLIYPVVRVGELIPFDEITQFFSNIDEDRAGSLQFRFDNEQMIVERAAERPYFGWGGWGRIHIFDDRTGRMLTVVDGLWVVTLAAAGWFGYLGLFGAIGYPLLLIRKLRNVAGLEISRYTMALVFILVIVLLNQIPNARLGNLEFLMVGALYGWVEQKKLALNSRKNGKQKSTRDSGVEDSTVIRPLSDNPSGR